MAPRITGSWWPLWKDSYDVSMSLMRKLDLREGKARGKLRSRRQGLRKSPFKAI